MSKKVAKICKLQFQAGGARPGPALASAGINMPQFCNAFNDATKDRAGDIVPVIITAYEDKSFDFVLNTSLSSDQEGCRYQVRIGQCQSQHRRKDLSGKVQRNR